MDKNFGLSSNDFNKLVKDLKKNETDFFKTVFLKHFQKCVTFLQKKYGASFDDAYDATMDALIKFRGLLVDEKLKYGNLSYLFNTMASQIYFKNSNKFKTQEFETMHFELFEPEDQVDEEDLDLINVIWNDMSQSCQELFKFYYYGNMKLIEIAEQEGKKPEAVRKQKERCLKMIRTIFQTKKENS